MGDTNIAWTNKTWNPVRGCTRVSEGCRECYAEVLAARHSYPGGWGQGLAKWVERPDGSKEARWTGEIRTVEGQLDAPLHWRKPARIFVNSMSDLFHEKLPFDYVDKVFAVMLLAGDHTFQVLTKRPDRMLAYMTEPHRKERWAGAVLELVDETKRTRTGIAGPAAIAEGLRGGWRQAPPNVWLGTSTEDSDTFNERVELLGQVPCAIRFVSAEPLLDFIDVGNALDDPPDDPPKFSPIDWIIIGGESGSGHRPMDIDAARSLIAQCRMSHRKPAIFVKQDSGPRPGMKGRFTDAEWALKEYPA